NAVRSPSRGDPGGNLRQERFCPVRRPDRTAFRTYRIRCRFRRRACPGDPDLLGTEPKLSKYAGAIPATSRKEMPSFSHGREALRDAAQVVALAHGRLRVVGTLLRRSICDPVMAMALWRGHDPVGCQGPVSA